MNTTDNTKSLRRYLGLMDVSVLLLSILVFLIFLFLLGRIVFPEGERLGSTAPGDQGALAAAGKPGDIGLAGTTVGEFGSFVATLADISHDVKIRSANSIVWNSATEGAPVNDHDAVQTFAKSTARVDFTTDNELRIGQNSLVIFQSGVADPFLQRRDAAVVVMEGELSGSVGAEYGSLAVQLPAGLVTLQSEEEGGEAVDFRLNINPDKSSSISVHSGTARINVAGEHYEVSANNGLTITQDGRTDGVDALPVAPKINSPGTNALASFRETPPRVVFRWGKVSDAQSYRLEIARDKQFENILVDETLHQQSFAHGNLVAGNYYWRVSARSGWAQGPASQPRQLRVRRDTDPPFLEIEPVQATVNGELRLRGRTARNSTVYVGGDPVTIDSGGNFEYLFPIQPGAQAVVIEAVDAVGNVTYNSQIINARTLSGRSN